MRLSHGLYKVTALEGVSTLLLLHCLLLGENGEVFVSSDGVLARACIVPNIYRASVVDFPLYHLISNSLPWVGSRYF